MLGPLFWAGGCCRPVLPFIRYTLLHPLLKVEQLLWAVHMQLLLMHVLCQFDPGTANLKFRPNWALLMLRWDQHKMSFFKGWNGWGLFAAAQKQSPHWTSQVCFALAWVCTRPKATTPMSTLDGLYEHRNCTLPASSDSKEPRPLVKPALFRRFWMQTRHWNWHLNGPECTLLRDGDWWWAWIEQWWNG